MPMHRRLPKRGFVSLTKADTAHVRLFELAAVGVSDYTRRSTRLSAEAADPVQAGHLRLRPGAPLLRTVSVNVDPAGRPVEYGRSWFAGERVQLTVDTP